MKKILVIVFLFILPCFAIEEIQDAPIVLEEDIVSEDEMLEGEQKVIYENEYSPYSRDALRAIIEKDYDLNVPNNLFAEQLKLKFKKGPLEEVGARLNLQMNFTENISNSAHTKFNPNLINFGVKGIFRGGQEGFNTLFELTPNIHDNFMHRFVLDAWVETNRIPHNKLMFGTYRPKLGIEGEQSTYTLPFLARSQIARNFANIRKTGLRLKGTYKYFDYDIGGYSSDTYYSEFFPGVETDLWLQFKPLAKGEGKWGNMLLGGGYTAGCHHENNFQVASAAIGYDYKNFWTRAEYAHANGSNGASGLTDKVRQGWNVTVAYRITKKLEILARYDEFDPNVDIKSNNIREYTAGINYYLIGQGLRFILNYVFCQNQATDNSHRIILGTQILL